MQVQDTPFSQQTTLSTTFRQTLEARYGPGISEKFRGYEKAKIKLTKEETHLHFLLQARDQGFIPDGFRIKSPIPGLRAKKIVEKASKALIRSQISYHRFKKTTLLQDILQRFEEIKEYTLPEDHAPIFQKIDTTCHKVKDQHRKIHEQKLQKYKTQGVKSDRTTDRRTIINLSSKELTISQETLLAKGLNFTTAPKEVPILDIISSVDSVRIEEPLADEFRWKIRDIIQKSDTPKPNINREEQATLRELREDDSIKILPADKGNATVIMDIETYDQKIEEVLLQGNYTRMTKDPTLTIEGRIYRMLKKYEHFIPEKTRSRLTPHHSKPPHLYGLPKIHKQNVPLRPITSSRNSPTYELAKFLLPILQPLQGNTASFVKNSKHFVEIISRKEIKPEDRFISFDVESLYTNVPLKESLNIIQTQLEKDQTLSDRTTLPINAIIDLLGCCLNNSYFQEKDRFFSQDDGLPMGSSLSPIIANIYMEWFEDHAIRTATRKPKLWLRYVDDTFIIWDSNDDELQDFLLHLNNLKPSIKFTMEKEENNRLPFLDVIVEKKHNHVETSVYRKRTHTGQYLNFTSNHSNNTKHGIVRNLVDRAMVICNSETKLQEEIDHIKKDLAQNGYPTKLVDKIAEQRKIRRPQEQEETEKPTILNIPYVKGISEKIRRIGQQYNIYTVFRASNSLRSQLTKTKPAGKKDTKNCIYEIPCKCGKSYVGESKRPIETRVMEHQKHTTRGETGKSGVAEHAWSHGHHPQWTEARILHKEEHWRKRKFKEAAFIMQNPNCYSKPSVEIKNIWKPLLNKCQLNLRSDKNNPPTTRMNASISVMLG